MDMEADIRGVNVVAVFISYYAVNCASLLFSFSKFIGVVSPLVQFLGLLWDNTLHWPIFSASGEYWYVFCICG